MKRPPQYVTGLDLDAAMQIVSTALKPAVASRYITDPAAWARERLGVTLWSAQIRWLESISQHRYTAAPSCHDVGKSFAAAVAALWWIDTHPPGTAFVVSTAPTHAQVSAILWRELRRLHADADLPGRMTLANEWYLEIDGRDQLVGYGRKPGEYTQGTGFSGIHAMWVLVILDEACGIPPWLFNAADTLATNENARVFAPGNPDDPSSEFEKVCRPGSGWNVEKVSALDSPNFTGETVPESLRSLLISPTWVEERKKRWGDSSPIYQSKVLGEFPDVSDDSVFTPSTIRRAQELDLPGLERGVRAFDIARFGSAMTVGYWQRGGVCRRIYSASKQDTMRTTGDIMNLLRDQPDIPAWIDSVGLGAGVYDRLRELDAPVIEYNAGMPAYDKTRFKNRRAEVYWTAREMMIDDLIDIDPADEELAAELGQIRYSIDSRGRIMIETKEEMARRGCPSPDHADAFVMSLMPAGQIMRGTQRVIGASSLTGDLLDREM